MSNTDEFFYVLGIFAAIIICLTLLSIIIASIGDYFMARYMDRRNRFREKFEQSEREAKQ